ncbi:putative Mitochondrial ribosomal protein L37-domain-containing protein [Seiridium cardinale]|uniref:Large ribosomal subunit protein mL54 n=1 Tax=Seiridium cardinale TaxID=138064 RepID=A0ABR2X9Z8_9PEZI
MICRRCLTRASALARPLSQRTTPLLRSFISAPISRNAAAAPAPESPSPSVAPPTFSTPLGDTGAAEPKPSLSTCPEGTVLSGLNYLKNKTDPVALADDAYPEWLWKCLDVTVKKSDEGENADAEAEFSKSKKQRRLAAKRQRALEARLLAEGNLEALAPKIPLQQQSINMPANVEGTSDGALAAVAAREELRKAMRKERKAKIKESNYLKSM